MLKEEKDAKVKERDIGNGQCRGLKNSRHSYREEWYLPTHKARGKGFRHLKKWREIERERANV